MLVFRPVDVITLVSEGYDWTAPRVAAVRAADLGLPTPCAGWNLRHLLNHLLGALTLHLDAAQGKEVDESQTSPDTDRIDGDPATAFDAVADRAARTWREMGVLERTCVLPMGPVPASAVVMLHVTEVVIHGWDVGQATGEGATIPAGLAVPILGFAQQFGVDAHRGTAFGAELPSASDAPADRLLALLGRTP